MYRISLLFSIRGNLGRDILCENIQYLIYSPEDERVGDGTGQLVNYVLAGHGSGREPGYKNFCNLPTIFLTATLIGINGVCGSHFCELRKSLGAGCF